MAHQDTQITSAFGELMEDRMKRIRKSSTYGSFHTWRMQPLIVKYGDQVLQEEFAMQLVVCFQRIFHQEAVPVKLVPYRILAVSSKSGLIEPVPNSVSLDKLKKQHTNLLNFFMQTFGEPSEPSFKQAQQNFVKTMAGYSVVCYLLQLKDRHDGNVLLDSHGDIVHIDFGFLLSHTVPFERAPFKLTPEFVEVMGGYNSPCYKQYRQLCVKAFLAARRHYKQILMIIEMTMEGKGRKVLPCLKAGHVVLEDMTKRFCLDLTDDQCKDLMHNLIEEARGSWRTIVYNAYQLILNNIH
jgi:phosphatidylinositol 4-kinase